MKKCEVLADRVSLVVGKGSIVSIDDKQFELARAFLKPLDVETAAKPKNVETRENVVKEKKRKAK